ncbi:MAG: response regulator, partial [Cyanothece sp. SIO1E1]|nr:response regulator [Cyanothece sp. SIO1E1]
EGGKSLRWGKDSDERLIQIVPLAKAINYFSRLPEPGEGQSPGVVNAKSQGTFVILLHSQDHLLGFEVDQIIGEQELVIRPLGGIISAPDYIYGSSILADGQLTLVMDGSVLAQSVVKQQTESTPLSLNTQLPQLEGSQAQTAPILPAAPSVEPTLDKKSKVLLVDDSITARQTLALLLQKAGYQVSQVGDGYAAIEQLQYQSDINLVICDIEMPRMNGFEFLTYRQQDSVLSNIPVAMLTSLSGKKHHSLAQQLGATAYITKPYLEHKLLGIVSRLLENSRSDAVVS